MAPKGRNAGFMKELLQKIKDKEAKVSIIGAGYVGLPLAVESAVAGFTTTVYDTDEAKIAQLREGRSYIPDVLNGKLRALVGEETLRPTSSAGHLWDSDVIIICVPTPLRKTGDPDVSYIDKAVELICQLPDRGPYLVILESTTYPGYTRECVAEELQGVAHVAFSPERVDPGNEKYKTTSTPKVVGGVDKTSLDLACTFYEQFIHEVVPVSSTDAAEMVKLLENTFRAVNIALVNEMALMCGKLDLDIWEVIEAAATKPFGFMKFTPGPGLGGHCLPCDPQYLAWRLRGLKYHARFIDLAEQINGAMPQRVVEMVTVGLSNRLGKALNDARVHLLGVAYKPEVGDVRESPAIDIMHLLARRGAGVSFEDPHVHRLPIGDVAFRATIGIEESPERLLEQYDAVVVVTDHQQYHELADRICKEAKLIIDTRNVTKDCRDRYPGKVLTF